MKKEYPKTDEIGNKNPFKVPEGYFEKLNEQLLRQLDEAEVEVPRKASVWDHVKPWVYMAAMFSGAALMFNIFLKNQPKNDENQFARYLHKNLYETIILEEEDYDDFYDFLEHQAIEQNYREEIFINEY